MRVLFLFSRIHQILQNLFAFVIFLSHSFGILISVKGNPRGINECRLQPPACAGIGREHASPLSPCGFACSRKPNDPIFADVFHIFLLRKKRLAPFFSFFLFLDCSGRVWYTELTKSKEKRHANPNHSACRPALRVSACRLRADPDRDVRSDNGNDNGNSAGHICIDAARDRAGGTSATGTPCI